MLDRLGKRVELKQGSTVVIDRGMAFDENVADIKQRKLHYIVASRQPERDPLASPISRRHRWIYPRCCASGLPRSIQRRRRPRSRVKICTGDDDEQALTCSVAKRATHRQRCVPIRVKQQGRLLADIEKLAQRVASQKSSSSPIKSTRAIGRALKERCIPASPATTSSAMTRRPQPSFAQFDADKHRKAEQLDGCYLLKTESQKPLSR